MAIPAIPPSVTRLTNTPLANAQAILRSASAGITDITSTLGVSPTFSQAATNAASTINAANAVATTTTNFATGRYAANDTRFIEQVGGTWAYNGSSGYIGDTVINVLATPTRQGGHGSGLKFMTRAAALELGMQNSGGDIIVYVTDPATRIRSRIQTLDQTTTTGLSYVKWVFASAALRIWEIYPVPFTRMTNIVVGAGDSLWPAPTGDEPKIGFIWDSWGSGSTLGGVTAHTIYKQAVCDFVGQRLGVANPRVAAVASTGLLSGANVATSGTFRQRIAAGDIDVSRIGPLAALYIPGSLNDQANSDAACQAEYALTIAAAMVAQPNAIIFGAGPQYTTNTNTTQTRYDAHAAGFAAAAGGAKRMIYIDHSGNGENYLFAGNVATYVGGDGNHLNDAGQPYYGRRIGDSMVNGIRTVFGL